MKRAILKRLVANVVTFLALVTIVFFLVRLSPIGPFSGERVLPEATRKALEDKFNLNDPLYVQYGNFLLDLAQLDMGPSFHHPGRSVQSLIAEGLPVTLTLGFSSLGLALLLGFTTGIGAALRHNRWQDLILSGGARVGISLPDFVTAYILMLVFAVWLRWLPVQGWGTPVQIVLPIATLTLYYTAIIQSLMRGGMLQAMHEPFIATAHAKGVGKWRIVWHHATRQAFRPTMNYLGPAVAGIFGGGSLIVENIFNLPGIGRYFVEAAVKSDYTMIQGTSITYFVMLILMNSIVDGARLLLDPRLRKDAP